MSSNGSTISIPGSSSALNKKSFHFLAGLFSGLASSVLLQPADLLKTRLQQSSKTHSSSPLLSTLRTIFSSPHPIRHLWRGTLPSALRTSFGSALYFGGLDWLRGAILARPGFGVVIPQVGKKRLSNAGNLVTGAFARAAAGFVMMPITVIKVRYESSLYNYSSLNQAAGDILRRSGWRGFFAGFGATAVRDAPYAGLYVLFYEAGKRKLHIWLGSSASSSSASVNFASGTLAAGLATAVTNPFDAIKTRLQLQPERYGNMVQAARVMVGKEGWRCLFDGLGLRMARKGMSSALAWTVYEELVRRAEVRWLLEEEAQQQQKQEAAV